MTLKQFSAGCTLSLLGMLPLAAQEVDYKPEVHGTIRGKYEYQPDASAGRFEVRNARFSLSGKIAPVVSYKAEIDLSDEGSIKMLDAYARYSATKEAAFTIGQMRVPFTIDAHRSPHQQYFANRSFIAKQVGNVRDVGATIRYDAHIGFPLVLEAGLFNGSGLTNQKDYWADRVNYSAKAQFQFTKAWNLTLSTQAIKPENVGIQMYDAGINYHANGWHIEAEYLYKHYADNAFENVNAFDGFVCYDIPLRRTFKKVSVLARYDAMSNHSNGKANADGVLQIDDAKRQRLTGGVTFSIAAPFVADIRVNYEKYFYDKDATVKVSEQDKFVIEFMTRF